MRISIFLVLAIGLFACNKNDGEIIYGYEYFPTDSGKYVIYDVMSINHDDLVGIHDTTTFQIKEQMGEEDIDLEGEPFTKLYRYTRAADTLNWALQDVWVVKKTDRSVEVVEENNRVIRMAFSISYDQIWDGNALNSLDQQQWYYRDIYEPMSIGQNSYDSTVVVERENFLSFIEYNRSYEVYARNIGRVQKYHKDIEIDAGDTLNVLKGTELFYTAVSWGE